jgi:hypothetical protein
MRNRRAGDHDVPPAEYLTDLRRGNYGFKELKILEGNVGYLDLRQFMSPAQAGEAATAAMNFLANADAIIFDLRQNGGGDPGMIQLLTSYLYRDGETRHLNSFYHRRSNDTTQTWTLPYVPGRRNPKAKVYVLTSNFTFSAAEEFTYNLKNLKRATIVGETTGGGAHPGGMHPVAERFDSIIPDGRAIKPITGTNREGVGVEPDVKVPAGDALGKAHFLALEELAGSAGEEVSRGYFEWYKTALQARLEPARISAGQLEAYAGVYGERTLIFENGKLYYQRAGRPKFELQALTADTFAPVGMSDFRITVEMNNGKAVALIARYEDGRTERNPRSETRP